MHTKEEIPKVVEDGVIGSRLGEYGVIKSLENEFTIVEDTAEKK